jgi:hypothetical protein
VVRAGVGPGCPDAGEIDVRQREYAVCLDDGEAAPVGSGDLVDLEPFGACRH